MSIGIGLITNDPHLPSVVLASDSRTEGDRTKRHDLSKITLIKRGQVCVGIVQAGPHEFSMAAVDQIKDRLGLLASPSEPDVRRIVCDSVADQRRHIQAINPGIPHRGTGCEFEFILATFEGNTPRLYTVNSFACIAHPETDGKAYIGNGKSLADYFLFQIDALNSPQLLLSFAAVYVVGIANRRVSDCEPPARIAIISQEGMWISSQSPEDQKFISAHEAVCEKIEAKRQNDFLSTIAGPIFENAFGPPRRPNKVKKKK